MSKISPLDKHILLAESMFQLSEEIRDITNTLDIIGVRKDLINRFIDCQNLLDECKEQYRIDDSELEESFSEMEF